LTRETQAACQAENSFVNQPGWADSLFSNDSALLTAEFPVAFTTIDAA
jgi:hypothetical protein